MNDIFDDVDEPQAVECRGALPSAQAPDATLSALARLPEAWLSDGRGRPLKVSPPAGVAVTYSRFSTDKQKEVSIERQMEVGHDHANRRGMRIIRDYADRARSGKRTVGRADLAEMLLSAERGEFAVVIVENVDRLARDLSILSTVFKKLEELGIEMHQAGRGKLYISDIAMHGLMGDEGRRILLERTQFSRDHMARLGLDPSGGCYGYDKVPGKPGHIVINPVQAKTVRLIYALCLEGLSPRQIALSLIGRGITDRNFTGPLVTHMLRNPRYNGLIVYKQYEHSRNRETGIRVIRRRPREEWIVTAAEKLRIVDAETWDRAQAMRGRRERRDYPAVTAPASPYLLRDKVLCPNCERPLRIRGNGAGVRYGCATRRENKKCSYRHTFYVHEMDRLALDVIGGQLLRPGYIQAYVDAYNKERERSDVDYTEARANLQRRITEARHRKKGTLDTALMRGFTPDDVVEIRLEANKDIAIAEADLARMPRKPIHLLLDEGKMTTMRDALESMRRNLPFRATDEASFRFLSMFGNLIERIDPAFIGFGKFDATFTLKVSPVLGDDNGEVGFPDKVRLTGSHRWHRNAYSESNQAKVDQSRLEEGHFAITDKEWDRIRGMMADGALQDRKGVRIDGRTLIDALVFRYLTGSSWEGLPAAFGSWMDLKKAGHRLSYLGAWDPMLAALHRMDPKRYARLLRPIGDLRPARTSKVSGPSP